jgi:hypothetical protein
MKLDLSAHSLTNNNNNNKSAIRATAAATANRMLLPASSRAGQAAHTAPPTARTASAPQPVVVNRLLLRAASQPQPLQPPFKQADTPLVAQPAHSGCLRGLLFVADGLQSTIKRRLALLLKRHGAALAAAPTPLVRSTGPSCHSFVVFILPL